jgi:hypothetical protein
MLNFINYLKITLLLALLTSCYRNLNYPSAEIPKEKMISVLADIHLAEAKVAGFTAISQPERDSITAVYYETIFRIYDVKAEAFDQSMNAYMQNPEELSKIYEKVLEKLQKDELGKSIKVESIKK